MDIDAYKRVKPHEGLYWVELISFRINSYARDEGGRCSQLLAQLF